MMCPTSDTHQRLLSIAELQSRLGGVSKATVYRMIDRGDLPRPLKLGPKLTRFRQSDIDAALVKLRSVGVGPL